MVSCNHGATRMCHSHTHPGVPRLWVPSSYLHLHGEVVHIVPLFLPRNHTAMLQEAAYCITCSKHLRTKRLMENLYRVINYHVSTCLLMFVMCLFFSVCLLVFEGEEIAPHIRDNFSSKFNHMSPYFCSGWMKQIFIYSPLVHEVRPAPNLASLLPLVYSSVFRSSL